MQYVEHLAAIPADHELGVDLARRADQNGDSLRCDQAPCERDSSSLRVTGAADGRDGAEQRHDRAPGNAVDRHVAIDRVE